LSALLFLGLLIFLWVYLATTVRRCCRLLLFWFVWTREVFLHCVFFGVWCIFWSDFTPGVSLEGIVYGRRWGRWSGSWWSGGNFGSVFGKKGCVSCVPLFFLLLLVIYVDLTHFSIAGESLRKGNWLQEAKTMVSLWFELKCTLPLVHIKDVRWNWLMIKNLNECICENITRRYWCICPLLKYLLCIVYFDI
jgi:hypothetical protein